MNRLKVLFYPDGFSGPVVKYLEELEVRGPSAWAKLTLDLTALESEGARSNQISVRPMGQGLWELKRLFEGVQY